MADDPRRVLVTGASGYVGGRLLPVAHGRGLRVRAMARRPERLSLPDGIEAAGGDVLSGEGLDAALDGVDTALYLVHSMGRGSDSGDFAERDRRGARNFARAARAAGVRRVVYLGGLGPDDGGGSAHLRSRHEVAEVLAAEGPPLAYVRAAMVIGAGSASFQMLRALVDRLPVMVCPSWIDTPSQPIAVGDVVAALAALAAGDHPPGEFQVGGADVVTYRDMMSRYAAVAGRRAPSIVRVPVLSPRLSSYWVTLVTPVEHGLVRPLVDGLVVPTVVERPAPNGVNEAPLGFDEAVRVALKEPA